ncbi:DUF6088 family protein [Pseudoflavitalea rhizosphaerae]|uniref:DUF6088 family protein n=1 Tax=Pseudoflavitalea rhizosphaerae TaxID=1884793 RepID=UPI000F8F6EDF|nr:DUF6088 family protein [Pseudoflavitalea rhizosphaerae]
MASLKETVFSKIRKRGKGYIFFTHTFRDLGDNEGVKLALHRLVKEKEILRLAKGIYYYPKRDPELGILLPSLEDVAREIAKRDNIIIRPTGSKSMNQLGLSQQVPINVVYLTNGPSRKIAIGKNNIHFKHVNNRQLAVGDGTIGNIIFALREIGKDQLTAELIEDIHGLLSHIEPTEIASAAKQGPPWIADFLIGYLKQRHAKMVKPAPGEEN